MSNGILGHVCDWPTAQWAQIESNVSTRFYLPLYGTSRSLDSPPISEPHEDEESNSFKTIAKVQGTGQMQGKTT